MSRKSAEKRITKALLRRWPLPDPGSGDKNARGQVLVVGGSPAMLGGVILAATAALRSGAGKLQAATVRSGAMHVAAQVPEAYVLGLHEKKNGAIAARSALKILERAADARALLIGPGMVDESEVARLVEGIAGKLSNATLVLDAAALAAVAKNDRVLHRLNGNAIITPHLGEMAMMTGLAKGDVKRNAKEVATRMARELRCVVVLKGAVTFVVGPDSKVFRNDAGDVGLATSGSGDTLSGVIAGLVARGAEPLQAASWGVFLHACAGERLAKSIGRIGFLARELLAEVPVVLSELET